MWCGLLALSVASHPAHAQSGRIVGAVFDSVVIRPLPGAVVQMVSVSDPSLSRTIVADSLGRFRADTVPVGAWALAAMHPRLDSLGLDQIRGSATVAPTGQTRVTIAVPSARPLARLVCGAPAIDADTSGYLIGTLRTATPSRAAVAGRVHVEWLEMTVTGKGFVRTRETRDVAAGGDGRFLVCDVPGSGLVRVTASSGADSSGIVSVQLPNDGIQYRDLYLGRARLEPVSQRVTPDSGETDTTATMLMRRGDGRVRGRLLGANGTPLADARLVMRDAGMETRTDASGRFAFTGLPTGTYNLDARSLGYEPLTRPVDVLADDSTTLSFAMSRLIALDTVRIRALLPTNPAMKMAAFEEHRKAGFGRFLGPAELESMQPMFFTDAIRAMPSLRLERGDYGYVITMRGTGMAPRCAPTVWVDNVRTPNDGSLDSFLNANQIAAIEVYQGAFGPPQYLDFLSGCGSIVVWTGPRTVAPTRR
jgi:hypothetical protein